MMPAKNEQNKNKQKEPAIPPEAFRSKKPADGDEAEEPATMGDQETEGWWRRKRGTKRRGAAMADSEAGKDEAEEPAAIGDQETERRWGWGRRRGKGGTEQRGKAMVDSEAGELQALPKAAFRADRTAATDPADKAKWRRDAAAARVLSKLREDAHRARQQKERLEELAAAAALLSLHGSRTPTKRPLAEVVMAAETLLSMRRERSSFE